EQDAWGQASAPARRLPESVAAGDVDAFVASLRTHRDRAMVLAMLLGGLRSAEARRLKLADVDMGRRRVRVVGKGGKERQVPVDPAFSPSWPRTCGWSDRHGWPRRNASWSCAARPLAGRSPMRGCWMTISITSPGSAFAGRAVRDRIRIARDFITRHPDLDTWMTGPATTRATELQQTGAWPLVCYALRPGRLRLDLDWPFLRSTGTRHPVRVLVVRGRSPLPHDDPHNGVVCTGRKVAVRRIAAEVDELADHILDVSS